MHMSVHWIQKINVASISNHVKIGSVMCGKYYFADLRMTFRQNFFLQDWFRNKFDIGLG
jgi:hypothetical protein